jgi:precorrin-2/cobalt-factor-2 C20-methyltransferase
MVSLGPGDVELLTYKALEVFKEVDVICVPTKSEDKSFKKSISYKIVQEALGILGIKKEIIPVFAPMRFKKDDWVEEAKTVLKAFKSAKKVAFVTLGDAGFYSSVYYILDIIKKIDYEVYDSCEIIAGVTSFSAASAKIKKPLCLGDERVFIEPLHPRSTPKTTHILMRPKINQDTSSLGEGDFYTFENLFLDDEKITPKKISKVKKYMTLFINFAKRF